MLNRKAAVSACISAAVLVVLFAAFAVLAFVAPAHCPTIANTNIKLSRSRSVYTDDAGRCPRRRRVRRIGLTRRSC